MNFEQRERGKKKLTVRVFPDHWGLTHKTKVPPLTRCLLCLCRTFTARSEFEEKMQADKSTQKKSCSVFASSLLSLPVSFSLLSLRPHHLGEVNDSAARVESRLFDLDSEPAFLNKYSVAQERWRVPSFLKITGYVWGRCFFWVLGPASATIAYRGELTGSINVAMAQAAMVWIIMTYHLQVIIHLDINAKTFYSTF